MKALPSSTGAQLSVSETGDNSVGRMRSAHSRTPTRVRQSVSNKRLSQAALHHATDRTAHHEAKLMRDRFDVAGHARRLPAT